jgi:hypothetical protein
VTAVQPPASTRRASLDGAGLSELARGREAAALEVSFGAPGPLQLGPLPVRIGASLQRRKDWADALDVGALVNLRALSVDLAERDTRGSKRPDLGPPWFWRSRLVSQLEEIDAYVCEPGRRWTAGPLRAHELVRWIDEMGRLPRLRRVMVRTLHTGAIVADLAALTFVLDRRAGGFDLRIQTDASFHDDLAIAGSIEASLAGFPRADVPSASLEYLHADAPPQMEALRRAIAGRFAAVTVSGRCSHAEI